MDNAVEKIFMRGADGKLIALSPAPYDSEDILQGLVGDYPALLAGDQMTPEEPRKWILVSREMGVPGAENGADLWYLDHLFLDQDGIPTLVEVKRSSDTRIRREVVGQMLDYAANASAYWRVEDLQTLYQGDLNTALGLDSDEEAAYWTTVESNLRLGKLRLVFLADRIPDALLRIIEFLNNQMRDTEVLGLEVRQYRSDTGEQIFVPKLLGRTFQSVAVKQGCTTREWDRESFLDDVEQTGGAELRNLAERILEEFTALGCRIWYGKGAQHSSIIVICDAENGVSMHLFGLYPWTKGVYVELAFQRLKAPFESDEQKQKLKKKFEEVFQSHIPDKKLKGRPSFPTTKLLDSEIYSDFTKVYTDMIHQFREANQA